MIFGVGTDIVHVARMQNDLERYGEKFARRILTDTELTELRVTRKPANFLARRFAVKEAVAKAFGTGFVDGLFLRHIGTGHDAHGKPRLECTDRAAALLRAHGIVAAHLSVTDEREYAVAFVMLEKA